MQLTVTVRLLQVFDVNMLSISLTEEGIFFLKSSNFSLFKLSITFWISLQWFKAYSLILKIVAISIILTDDWPLGLAKLLYITLMQ